MLWAWFVVLARRRPQAVERVWPAYLLTVAIALSVDVMGDLIGGLYAYHLPGLPNDWAVLTMAWAVYPGAGCVFALTLPARWPARLVHVVLWSALIFAIEVPSLALGELVYPKWRLWWSPGVYVATFLLFAVVDGSCRSPATRRSAGSTP